MRGFVTKVLDGEQIRDTNAHAGSVIKIDKPYSKVLIAIENTHDQDVSYQVYGKLDSDATQKWAIGSAVSVAAADDYGYAIVTEPWPYLTVVATASVQPTSGATTVWLAGIE